MSLSKLNDQLKADICSFLDFKDIYKLAQVNKGIKASLQRRGLDKPKIHSLCFERERFSRKWVCFAQLHSDSKYPNKRTTIAERKEDMNSTEVLNCINKFNAIEYLELRCRYLQDNAGWEDIVAKIRSVELENCDIKMSKEAVMKFFKKFEVVVIGFGSTMDPANITDEFFVELSRVGTTVHFWNYPLRRINHVVAVTDATLDAISRITVPNQLILKGLITGITFARVKKMIEDVLKSEMPEVLYDFGYLKSDQYNEAHSFLSEEFEGWAVGIDRSLEFYHFDKKDYDGFNYERYYISDEDHSFYFEFCVYKPEELLQNDNLGEAQFVDESDDEDVNHLGNLFV